MERTPPKRSERLKNQSKSGACQTTVANIQALEIRPSETFGASEPAKATDTSEPMSNASSTSAVNTKSVASVPLVFATGEDLTFGASATPTLSASAMPIAFTNVQPISPASLTLTASETAASETTRSAASTDAASLTAIITAMQGQIESLQKELRETQQSLRATASCNIVPPISVPFSITSSPYNATNTTPFSMQLPNIISTSINTRQEPLSIIGARETASYLPQQTTLPSYSSAYYSMPNAHNMSTNTPQASNIIQSISQQSNQMAPRKLVDLPKFTGAPEDWPAFFTAFEETTVAYNYSNLENNQRLQKCLSGEAREAVKSLLIHPNNVFALIDQLRTKFGRPDQLIRSQLSQVRDIVPISEHAIARIGSFATVTRNLTAFLAAAGGQQHLVNPTLLEELVSKLPLSKRVEWARYAVCIRPYATVQHFSEWLNDLANVICTVQTADSREQPKKRAVLHAVENQPSRISCSICQGNHVTVKCERLTRATVPDRWNIVKRSRLCFTCLKPGHATRECRTRARCTIDGCQKGHHMILHERNTRHDLASQPRPCITSSSSQTASGNDSEQQESVLTCARRTVVETKLLFKVLPVTLYGPNKSIDTYALLDEGSSITIMDEELSKQLGLQGKKRQLEVRWIAGRSANEPSTIVNLFISGLNMRKRHQLKNVFSVPKLDLPVQSLTETDVKEARAENLQLHTYENAKPKILIGLDHCHLGVPISTTDKNFAGPFTVQTRLGWTVFGPSSADERPGSTCLLANMQADNTLHEIVASYFQIENFGVRPSPPVISQEDARAQDILERTTKKMNGRFQTGLLWRVDNVNMPDSYPMALKRLLQIERKMRRDESFAATYTSIIEEYVAKNYARKLQPAEISTDQLKSWYLPHFGVLNPNKPLKLRLVFDAAAETEGISLNSVLLKGPQSSRQLPPILCHFRTGAVAVCADIKQMFHQVIIQPSDRCVQRFLWRGGQSWRSPDVYEMLVMTFGAACSPCSAEYVKTFNALSQRCQRNERAVKGILDYHYVDDYVDSFTTIEQAIEVAKEVRAIHAKGGFELRGFVSNSLPVIQALEGEAKVLRFGDKDNPHSEKVLGMYWQPQSDNFKYDLKFSRVKEDVINGNRYPTKRELLSIVMSIFDPLGFLSHFTIQAKLLMREVWRQQIRWDEPVPQAVFMLWDQWRHRLPDVTSFKVPRCYFTVQEPHNLQLHVFVDASEAAFSAVAYWRYVTTAEISTRIICAKARCAPLKRVTIPRLELQAAVLGCRLAKTVSEEHDLRVDKMVLWSDSTTVIKWINSEHRRYKPFVAHRIAEILDSTQPSNWRWLPTSENVADEATRPNNNAQLDSHSRWLTGPSFLKQEECTWPMINDSCQPSVGDEEELRRQYALISVSSNIIDFNRFSSLCRLVRAVAWVNRFVERCRKRSEYNTTPELTVRELDTAEKLLCWIAQRDEFSTEIETIERGDNVRRGSLLHDLIPYVDTERLLRVNGRIDAASWLPYDVRRPIILPPKHRFTALLVEHYHRQFKHQNAETVICEVRQKYWVPRIRRLLRKVQTDCRICKITRAQPRQPIMGPLPEDRLTPYVRPFTYTGLDYFGPVLVTIGRRTEKRWIALFTCLTIRAIHLEIAHDLSTDACIVVIRNFINRRGVPVRIRSDNGTNFIGANNEAARFKDVFEGGRIQDELASKGVEWLFSSPANPSEGGVWERMVQAVKRVLRQTLKEVAPKEHTLQCFILEAENVVNSRPLTHLPIHPEQEEPLTPHHFLLGSPNTARTPSVQEPNIHLCRLRKQWLIGRQLRDAFWKRWVMEYLPTLTRRTKWCRPEKSLSIGDLVFVCDVNHPRNQWSRGRVVQVYPGPDGVVRKADVRTSKGTIRRPASRLAILDIDGEP